MARQNIFIGREKQLATFKRSFEQIYLEAKVAPENLLPRIFLYYGEGGLGKSTLVNKCLERTAEQVKKQMKQRVHFFKIDWDSPEKQRAGMPNEPLKLIRALYTELTEKDAATADYFKGYLEVEQQIQKVHGMVEELRKSDWSKERELLVEAGSTAANTFGVPVPEWTKKGLNAVLGKGEAAFKAWLHKRQKLSREDIDLYENGDVARTKALTDGLLQLSQKEPVLLALDAYENIDTPEIEAWMRKVFLRQLFKKGENTRILMILSGRKDHLQNYRNDLSDSLLEFLNFDDILFTDTEVQAFAAGYGLTLEEADYQQIQKGTKGIPIVVRDVLDLVAYQQVPLAEVLQDLKEKRGKEIRKIIKGIVQRFLKYCRDDNPIKRQIYQLAMLRLYDEGAISTLWSCALEEVSTQIEALSREHSFIEEEKMHALVRELLRDYLIQQMDPRHGTVLRTGIQADGKKLCEYYAAQLKEWEEWIPDIADRYEDENYENTLLHYFNALCWHNPYLLFQELASYSLEILTFNKNLFPKLFKILHAFKNMWTGKHKRALKTLDLGIQEHKTLPFYWQWSSSKKNIKNSQNDLFDFWQKNAKKMTALQVAFLQYHQAEMACRLQEYDRAFTLLKKCQIAFEGGELLEEKVQKRVLELWKAYFDLGNNYYKQGNYPATIEAYKKAIEIKPDHHHVFNEMGISYYKQGNYPAAIESYQKAIEIKPDHHHAFNNMGVAYVRQGNYPAAIESYQKAIAIKPDKHEAFNNMGNAYEKQGNYPVAIEAYQKAIEIKPDYREAFNNMGFTYKKQGNYPASIESYQKALAIKPDECKVFGNLAFTYYGMREYEKGLWVCQKGLEFGENDWVLQNNYSLLLLCTQQFEAAKLNYVKTVSLLKEVYEVDACIEDVKDALQKHPELEEVALPILAQLEEKKRELEKG